MHSEPFLIINETNQKALLEKMILEIEKLAVKFYELLRQHKYHKLKLDYSISKCMDCK